MTDYTSSMNRLPKEPLIVTAAIVTISVVLAVGGIVYKTRENIQRDKLEFLADSNRKQVGPLRRVIQLRLAQDKARLIQFAATRSSLGPGRARGFGDFALISLVTPVSAGQWGLSWIEKGPLHVQQSQGYDPQVTLTSDQEVALLKSLPYDRIREGDIHWQRLSDSRGQPVWALAVSVETQNAGPGSPTSPTSASLPEGTDYQSAPIGTGGRGVVVGFFGRNPLLSATEDFIGSTSTAFVIDSRGYAATHSNRPMVGSLLKDDPAVRDVFSSRASAGATGYTGSSGAKIFSAFEQVDRTNLYVVMSTPETVAASTGQSFGRTAITTGALALFVGLLLVFAWGARLLPKASLVSAHERDLTSEGEDTGLDTEANSEIGSLPVGEYGRPNAVRQGVPVEASGPLEIPGAPMVPSRIDAKKSKSDAANAAEVLAAQAADRAAFISRFIAGLERGMKEPLLAAMAHVQLIKAKSSDDPSADLMGEISDHSASVDRDLRRAKDIIEELGLLSSQSAAPSNEDRADLSRLVQNVADHEQALLAKDGIAISLQALPVPLIRGREEPIKRVIAEILLNAQRALTGRSNKMIRLKLEDRGEVVSLQIQDNGIGMDRETRNHAFDPFFHAFDQPEARGLGLAKVRSVIQAHGGTCEISSSPGDGTTVTLKWPVPQVERQAFSARTPNENTTGGKTVGTHTGMDLDKLDFDKEGAHVLGGKVPLSEDHAVALPPSPVFSTDDDDNDDAWSFEGPGLGQSEVAVSPGGEVADVVKIRPVRRG